ncbi:RNA-binding domain-containing protein [Xylaria castorea]|nr:RNA-binding domain-containing protein [Xylaria castorea]
MHCVRRAALRAASTSSRFVAVPRQHVAANVMLISKANLRPTTVLPLSRYFSQTAPAAREENEADEAVDGAMEAGKEPPRVNPADHTVFVSNMTFDATDVHVEEAFSKYGEILSVNIARDGRGLSRGYGFVAYAEKESADRAIREAHNSFWHGRRIVVDHRKTRTEGRSTSKIEGPTNSLYIGNIPYEASDSDLNEMFRRLDNVTDVRVAVDRNTGWPRGFAHADFKDVESAQKAHAFLTEETIGGRHLRIDFAENRTPKKE